ncbi:MAG: long-chain fatty acid--CoA ligase [Arachidicoccus sp.]|nr:long-chain fatty acid--CoA ligase [Arachidicoccus sp.]
MIYDTERLFEILMPDKIDKLPNELLRYKKNGLWQFYTPKEIRNMAFSLAHYLLQEGINGKGTTPEEKGKVGLICFSKPEWVVTDLAVQLTGALLVPFYPNISTQEFIVILNETELSICFVSDMDLYQKIIAVKDQLPFLKKVFVLDDCDEQTNWRTILKPLNQSEEQVVLNNAAKIKTEDIATIIYTSGSTGVPKGVMLTHKNILSNVKIVSSDILPGLQLKELRALSFLPLCHIFEKMLLYTYLFNNASISFAESIDTISENLKEVQPNIFTSVPRLLEKVYEKIIQKGRELTGIKKNLFFWAVKLGLKYDLDKQLPFSYKIKLAIANKLIFSKWREALGGHVQYIILGGAACQPRLIRIFTAAKITILEGYGLTETSPVIAVNTMDIDGRKVGTVGKVLKNVQVKFDEDGVIYCKGDNIMMGYYKKPEETANVLHDGWFDTGDVGELIDGKYLKITDRKKEIFKTSGGKFVVPQPIESKLKEDFFIEQIIVTGEGKKFTSALIVPSFKILEDWCSKNEIPFTTHEDIINNSKVIALYQSIIDKYNPSFNHVEQIKKFVLLPNEWTVNTGELTPSVKIKRKVIVSKYEKEINSMYGEPASVYA